MANLARHAVLPHATVLTGPSRQADRAMIKTQKAVERAMFILDLLDSSRRGLNISEIGRRIGVPKSTTHLLIRTLEQCGYLIRNTDSREYSLSMKAFALGDGLTRAFPLAEAALPAMRLLSEHTRLASHLAIADRNQATCIQAFEPENVTPLDLEVGRRVDLHCTAVGKVILAYAPSTYLDQFLARPALKQYTIHTITSFARLRFEIQQIRKLGYAVNDQEEEMHVCSVAVPVRHPSGLFTAGLAISGATTRMPLADLAMPVRMLRTAAAEIEETL